VRASVVDRLWRVGLRVAYRLQLVYWFVVRPRHTGAGVAVWHGDRLLMIRNSYRNSLCLPAGGLKRREQPIDAAVRELREEVGIEVGPEALHYAGELVDRSAYVEDHLHVFELRCEEVPATRVDGREVIWAGFMTPAEALERGAVRVTRQYLTR
jgi:8-oxo-dGTP pyrophosphatase MutT (NUDIX family)